MRTFWSDLKSVLLAVAIAMLIWIYAEGQSLASRTVNVAVQVSSDAQSGVEVRADDPNFRGVARVRLEGTSRNIDDAAALLSTAVRLTPGLPGVPVEPGVGGAPRAIDLREAISSLPEMGPLGATVAEVDPPTISARVLRLVARDVPIRVELPASAAALGLSIDGEPAPTPASATLRLPEGASIPDGLNVIAVVPESELRRFAATARRPLTAVVKPPASVANSPGVQVSPEQVSVLFRIRRRVETVRLPSVPVWFQPAPTEDAGRWSIEVVDKFINDVSIAGPTDELRRVSAGEVPIKALIELSSEELERGVSSKTASFPSLPVGVTASASNPIVRLKIVRRDASSKP